MKVLVIDDENDIRRIARLALGRVGGMDVIEACSGSEGLRLACEEQPDAILLDVMMPRMDGPATLVALRSQPAAARIPIVFLTAKAGVAEIERLMRLGASGVLTKPFDPMSLARDVRRVLQGS
jgi:two-component system, OmpR family, response regulator